MIFVNTPVLSGNEKKYLCECIETGWISSEGPFVKSLEAGMAELTGRKHGIAVCNGSVALDVAIAALGLGPGDEVIMPAFTIVSCCASVVRAGATPVLVDADPVTWNMEARQIAAKITPRTKAIMVVHIYGLPVEMGPVVELARQHGLRIIEDAAEVIGQTCRAPALDEKLTSGNAEMLKSDLRPLASGHCSPTSDTRPCGSFGDVSTLSFYPNKHITTGEGGMVLVNDDALAERCRSLRNLCFDKERRFIHEELGWNFRMSNMQAAVGVAQLERIEETVRKKREIGAWYNEFLVGVPGLQLPLHQTDYATNIYWVYGVVLDDSVPMDAREVIKRLREKGVDCRHFFWPMNRQPVFHKMGLFENVTCPMAERLAERGFYLPSGLALTRDQAEICARALRDILA
jgi:perosamine synthetase